MNSFLYLSYRSLVGLERCYIFGDKILRWSNSKTTSCLGVNGGAIPSFRARNMKTIEQKIEDKKLTPFLKEFTFHCCLINKKDYEEDFILVITDTALILAKNKLDTYLQDEWGWITKRIYKNEAMGSDRYWSVSLEKVIITDKRYVPEEE